VLLLASSFSEQGGFKLASLTFGDYWVGVPLLLIGVFLVAGGVSSRSWIVALLGTFLVVGAAGLLLLVATPDTSGTATTPGFHTAALDLREWTQGGIEPLTSWLPATTR
jgi:hypothetical protein